MFCEKTMLFSLCMRSVNTDTFMHSVLVTKLDGLF